MQSHRPSRTMISKVKSGAFRDLRASVLEHNGIIFGGFVRDEYIAEYYYAEYNKLTTALKANEFNPEKYWDPTFFPETKARLLLPDDMDISFQDQQDADRFIVALKEKPEFERIIEHDVHQGNRYCPAIQTIKEVIVVMSLGKIPFVTEGTAVTIKLDIVVTRQKNSMPPFMNLDMLCNAFIIKKDPIASMQAGRTIGTKVLSFSTGTYIDCCSDYERTMMSMQILKDMKDFKTVLCFRGCLATDRESRNAINLVAMKRIDKMQKKAFPWKFINMPFSTKLHGEPTIVAPPYLALCGDLIEEVAPKEEQDECSICTTKFVENDKIAYTKYEPTVKNGKILHSPCMHYKCLMKYLSYQKQEASPVQYRRFVFRCPYRNIIDFSRCSLDIQKIYKIDL